ncbi:MAG: DUF2520 domain-containing protein [Dehalococcoidales bacterium]|nr:DUF2520 domain-containing protein [Dehalococcoidales bacterium]
MLKIGIIGAGTVGTALATKLNEKGYKIVAVADCTRNSAEKLASSIAGCKAVEHNQDVADAADFVFITTPDSVIPVIASGLRWHKGQSVVHCSGADSTEVLQPARRTGADVGVFHPLQTFASVKQAIDNIPGSTFAIEAEEPLLTTLKQMSDALNGKWIELKPEDKVMYHAAAVIASNYMVTLVKLADDLWQTFGIPREQATQALLPLLKGTLNNIANVGIPQCLTGPIARGDTVTVKKHLESLKKEAPDVLSTYCELGLQTIPIALAKGKIDEDKAAELRALLKTGFQNKSNTKVSVDEHVTK